LSLFTCSNNTDCEASDYQLCPPDSELVFNATSDLPSYCRCNVSRCALPDCATGFTVSLVQRGRTRDRGEEILFKTGAGPARGLERQKKDAAASSTSFVSPWTNDPFVWTIHIMTTIRWCQFNIDTCQLVTCPAVSEEECPEDSERPPSTWTEDGCCQLHQGCVCHAEDTCPPVECPEGFQIQVVSRATRIPGSCCDKFRCVNAVYWLPLAWLIAVPAPEDNALLFKDYRLTQVVFVLGQPVSSASPHADRNCGSYWWGTIVPWFTPPATGRSRYIATAISPCCVAFCTDVGETGLTCSYEDRHFQNGESWQIEKCTMCTCNDGISRCRVSSCSPPPCGWMVIPDGECCPVCRGCVSDSGGLYNNSDVWRENDCVTCQCQDGQVLCQAEMCAVECSHPRPIPGQCCPVCDEPDPVVTPRMCPSMENCSLDCPMGLQRTDDGCVVCKCKPKPCDLECEFGRAVDDQGTELCQCNALPPRCPSLDSCQKKCVYGYKIGRAGCQKCRCNKCPVFSCTKRCLHGFLVNEDGYAPPLLLPPPTTPNLSNASVQGRSCLTPLGGVRREDGEAWDDGCRLCFCRNGREMCSLIACPAPRCENPIFRIGDCCPSCPGVAVLPPGGERELCQSASGEYHVEGETWALDSCTQCLCHAGTVLCETPVCPPVLCHHPVKPTGSCCAICKGEDESNLSVAGLVERPCKSATGVSWQHDQVWWAGPCQSCQCQGGQVTCYSQVCPPLNCNKTVLRKGQCCPTCVGEFSSEMCFFSAGVFE
ncbi:hypothetical protein BaRGS_00020097, partial [Batillaria attramentaria]